MEEPAPTSDIEMPDVEEDEDKDEEDEEKPKEETPKKKKKVAAAKSKSKAATGKGKGKGKGKGGVQVPEEWPWEKAKELFEKPDVLPADEVEVWSLVFSVYWGTEIHFLTLAVGMEKPRCRWASTVPRSGKRIQVSFCILLLFFSF